MESLNASLISSNNEDRTLIFDLQRHEDNYQKEISRLNLILSSIFSHLPYDQKLHVSNVLNCSTKMTKHIPGYRTAAALHYNVMLLRDMLTQLRQTLQNIVADNPSDDVIRVIEQHATLPSK